MQVILDVEANGLKNPTQVWVVVCVDIKTEEEYIFRNLTSDEDEKKRFLEFTKGVTKYVGHSILEYDLPVLASLIGLSFNAISPLCVDTLIVSRLLDYSRPKGHSIEAYGEEFGLPKITFTDFSKYSTEMEVYCVRDCHICLGIYKKYLRQISDTSWHPAIQLEHEFQCIVNTLHNTGFPFDTHEAKSLLQTVTGELERLDKEILSVFKPRLTLTKEIHPRRTKHGTLNRSDFRWVKDGDLSDFSGGPFSRCEWKSFNPASHKAVVNVLANAGWKPEDRTKASIDTEREINRLKYTRGRSNELDIRLSVLYDKQSELQKYGWKINEANLSTLPDTAPSPARTLAKRILLESRRRTLTEWLSLVTPAGRIHGKFYGIGTWPHRMSHQNPNTANIPGSHNLDGSVKLYGEEMRSLWKVFKKQLLIGVDADAIQLRIFAHYIDDKEFTEALVNGRKENRTDAHSLNQSIIGRICKSRAAAKRFIYARLLGAGIKKLAAILECDESLAKEALDRILERYTGFGYLNREVIPHDAQRGYFIGLDGRRVKLPGDTTGQRKHLAMSGYLQNGEATIMKKACLRWHAELIRLDIPFEFVNFVHDEWQTVSLSNNLSDALKIAEIQANSIRLVGEELKLLCPLKGSYFNEDLKDYTIATNWSRTH